MNELNITELRALIRLIPPLRALRDDVEKGLHLELYHGAGDLVVRSLEALRDQIYAVTNDPYVSALTLSIPPDAKDKAKFSQVLLVSGQLLAYLEAQTGITGISGERRGSYNVQTAPNINLNMGDVIDGQVDRIMDVVNSAMRNIPRPPKPPKPPKPPRGPKLKRDVLFYSGDDEDEDEDNDEE